MKVFISHNKADKATARALAVLLVEQGQDVWFDEWDIGPGDSIAGGIEVGLGSADVFVLLWSELANASNWVGAELKAFIHRKVADDGLRIVPIMLDGTQLPALVADYRGFDLSAGKVLGEVVLEMTGNPRDIEVAQMLQAKLIEMNNGLAAQGDPLPFMVCPRCASPDLNRTMVTDDLRDETYISIECRACGWTEEG